MRERPATIPQNRALSEAEHAFAHWLLSHGGARSRELLPQLDAAWVVGKCSCGCASINLSVGGVSHYGVKGMETLCTFRWQSPQGHQFEVFAFACGGLLAGIDLWSVDGQSIPTELPDTQALERFHDW